MEDKEWEPPYASSQLSRDVKSVQRIARDMSARSKRSHTVSSLSDDDESDGVILYSMDQIARLIKDVLLDGLHTEGTHHKQYALYRIAEILGLSHLLDDVEDKGIPG